MLLSTTYGLNSSYTKKIHVGLRNLEKEGFDFLPYVKLSAGGAEGIYFDMTTWEHFQQNLGIMSEYLDGGSIKPNPIIIGKIIINFTTSYGARAVLAAYRETEEEGAAEENTASANENEPTTKKRKTYSVALVMQKTTFQGMLNVLDCVNANLNQLNIIASSANECAKYLVNEIQINLPIKGYIENVIVKLTLKANCQDIQRNVRNQLKDLTFLDAHFEIFFF